MPPKMDSFDYLENGSSPAISVRAGAFVARVPRGITRKRPLLAALAASLDFPNYFGGNWDALEECLRDLSWLKASQVHIVHGDLPCTNNPDTLTTYLEILQSVVTKDARNSKVTLRVMFPSSAKEAITRILNSA